MKLVIDLGPHVGPTSCIKEHLSIGCCTKLQTRKFGTVHCCSLYRKDVEDPDDPTQPLRRLPECLAAEEQVTAQVKDGPGPCKCGQGYDDDGDGDCPKCATRGRRKTK